MNVIIGIVTLYFDEVSQGCLLNALPMGCRLEMQQLAGRSIIVCWVL